MKPHDYALLLWIGGYLGGIAVGWGIAQHRPHFYALGAAAAVLTASICFQMIP